MDRNDRAARYSDLFDSNDQHASDCAYCPICAAVSVVGKTRPEVLEHLAAAARELMIAAGMLLEGAEDVLGAEVPTAAGSRPGRLS